MSKIDTTVLFIVAGMWEFICFYWPAEMEFGTFMALFYM